MKIYMQLLKIAAAIRTRPVLSPKAGKKSIRVNDE